MMRVIILYGGWGVDGGRSKEERERGTDLDLWTSVSAK